MIKRFFIALASLALVGAGLAGAAPAQGAQSAPAAKRLAPISKPVTKQLTGQRAAKSMMLGTIVHEYVTAQGWTGWPVGTQGHVPAGSTGVGAQISVEQPTIDTAGGDSFSLMQIAVNNNISVGGGAEQRNIAEIGVEVYPAEYGDSNPHLFTSWWKHGIWQGRNNCVDNAAEPLNAGASALADVGTRKHLGINYDATTPTGGGWWVSYTVVGQPTRWICHFPSTRWTNAGPGGLPSVTGFTTTDEFHAYGEVTVDNTNNPTTTQMGDGSCGTSYVSPWVQAADPALISSMTLYSGSSAVAINPIKYSTVPTAWDEFVIANTAMTVGGGGTGTC